MKLRLTEGLTLGGIALGMLVGQFMGLHGIVTTFFSLFGLVMIGYFAGPRMLRTVPIALAVIWGTLGAVAALMLLRSAWFYLDGRLDAWADAWTLAILLLLALVYVFIMPEPERHPFSWQFPPLTSPIFQKQLLWNVVLTVVSIGGILLIIRSAIRASTALSVRTPWPLLPDWTLFVIGTLWAVLLIAAWKEQWRGLVFLQAASAIAALTIITPLLYAIGYGFDGFLHIAGESVLANTGTLMPKPPYYMGQYVFVTWIADLFGIAVAHVDRWLVPMSATLFLPGASILFIRKTRRRLADHPESGLLESFAKKPNIKQGFGPALLAALVLAPLAAFVTTTPHGFATVLAITAIVLCTGADDHAHPALLLPLLFALWSAVTHPLVGLPILFAILMAIVWCYHRWLAIILAISAGVSVPLVFGLASDLGSAAGVAFDLSRVLDSATWSSLFEKFIPWVPNRFSLWAQASVWIERLLPWTIVAFAFLSLARQQKNNMSPAPPWMLAAGSVFVAAVFLRVIGDFGFLIDYERGNYADRLFLVSGLLLLPRAHPEFARRLEQATKSALLPKLAVVVAIGFLGAGVSYAALPRHDAVTPSRGWSVGSADIEAVKLIDQDAAGEPYTVLANQSVSAAAVKTFGFKRYNNDVFFYPIPTGGKLYDVFLRASYEDPSRETMNDAARLGGSDLVYFVVNDYWWDAGRLAEAAASSSDRIFDIQDGKVKVFKYVTR